MPPHVYVADHGILQRSTENIQSFHDVSPTGTDEKLVRMVPTSSKTVRLLRGSVVWSWHSVYDEEENHEDVVQTQ